MKIDKTVPIPETPSSIGRPPKYPFKNMEVGDSIFFHGEKIGTECRPYLAAKNFGRAHGMKFMGRTVDGGARIWRIA